jgi:transposase
MEYYIKEEAWSKVFEHLKKIKGVHIKDEGQIRRFMEAVWYMARSGCQWRLLPSYYKYLYKERHLIKFFLKS